MSLDKLLWGFSISSVIIFCPSVRNTRINHCSLYPSSACFGYVVKNNFVCSKCHFILVRPKDLCLPARLVQARIFRQANLLGGSFPVLHCSSSVLPTNCGLQP